MATLVADARPWLAQEFPDWDPEQTFEVTGEPYGSTWWRRWRVKGHWHPLTPAEVIDEYDWLFDFTPPTAPKLSAEDA